jgi:hypothetical protein
MQGRMMISLLSSSSWITRRGTESAFQSMGSGADYIQKTFGIRNYIREVVPYIQRKEEEEEEEILQQQLPYPK